MFLKAAGFEPPSKIIVHSHWTMNGMKMSKSLGNVIDPFDLFTKYNVDAIWSYLISAGPLYKDMDFEEKTLVSNYNDFILNSYVNMLYRCTAKKFESEKYSKGEFTSL